jgi:hypothetical protein
MIPTKKVALVLALLALCTGARAETQGAPLWPEAPLPEGIPPARVESANNPKIPIDLSGYFWVDSGYLQSNNAQAGDKEQRTPYMQGRFVLGAQYERELGDFFGLARLQLLGLVNEFKSTYTPHTLDAYVKVGQTRWDVQVGRFLAWEVYYRGQGIELYTAEEAGAFGGPSMYLLDFTRGHMDQPGQAAVHLYPFTGLGIEVAGVFGQDKSTNQKNLGIRPVARLKLGGLGITAGAEYLEQNALFTGEKARTTSKGFAARVQYTLAGATLGVDYARANVFDVGIDDLVKTDTSGDRTSMGAFLDWEVWKSILGLGYHFTEVKNDRSETNQQGQAFVSYLQKLPIEGLSVKVVYGYAQAFLENVSARTEYNNDLNSFRVRIGYDFK